MSTPGADGRLAALETAEAARAIVADYAYAVDAQDLDALRTVFAPDALLTAGERRWQGIGEIEGFFDHQFTANPCARRHFITTVQVSDATAERASVRSYFIFTTAVAGTSILGWGQYRDRVAWTDAGLRIAEKDISVDHQGPVEDGWADRLAAEVATR